MGNVIGNMCKQKTLNIKMPKDMMIDPKEDDVNTVAESPKPKIKHEKTIDDFTLKNKLGQGGYGAVYMATHKHTRNIYAIKVIKKKMFRDAMRIKDALNEKNIMAKASHPFIVKLHYSFQDKRNIYYAMDYLKGGILLRFMKSAGRFSEDITRFYIGQVLLGLKYLHEEKSIVYRDLKPENILVDEHGYIKLSDFGLSAMGVERLNSFCGTYEYIAPEILRGEEYCKCVDYFSLGVLVFEMLYGVTPFKPGHNNRNGTIIKNILSGRFQFDSNVRVSDTAKDLIRRLLHINPKQRLGANGATEIQQHNFFISVNWDELYRKKINPPFKIDHYAGFVERKPKFAESVTESNISVVVGGFEYNIEDDQSLKQY